MSFSPSGKSNELHELVGRLCNEDLDAAGRIRLSELLADNVEAQREYVRCVDMQAAMRDYAQSIDDEDFVLMEAQAALDAMPTGPAEEGSIRALQSMQSPSEDVQRAPITRTIVPFALSSVHPTTIAVGRCGRGAADRYFDRSV